MSQNWIIALSILVVVAVIVSLSKGGEGFSVDPNASYLAEDHGEIRASDADTDAIEGGDWGEIIKSKALDQYTIDSHRAFVNDPARTTARASAMPIREYDDGPVPFVGFRRPEYRRVKIGAEARTVPSEYPDQMPDSQRYLL